MNRKLIACLLIITVLCGLLPTFALANSTDEEPMGEDGAQESSFYGSLISAASFGELYALMTDTGNSAALSQLTFEQLRAVEAQIDLLYESLEKKDADTEYQKKLLHGQIETLIAQNDTNFAALIDSCTCSANKSRLVIHAAECPAYIAPPETNVEEIGTSVTGGYEFTQKVDTFTMDLTYAMQFATQESYTELQEAYYGMWVADFVITTNKSITGADAYLAGQYDAFDGEHWVKISVPETDALEAGAPLQLIPMVTGWTFPFLSVVEYIPTFNCGIWVSESYLQANPGFAVSVELRLYPSTDGNNYDDEVYYTLSKINYQSTNATVNYIAGANGAVDVTKETVGTLVHPTGSTPTADVGYRFAGWFTDAAYQNAVPSEWVGEGNKLIPGTNESGIYGSATYYAKFDPVQIDVTVNVTGDTTGDSTGGSTETQTGETYLFCLSGTTYDGQPVNFQFVAKAGEECKIVGLPDGNYKVAPVSDWNGGSGTAAGVENGSATVVAPSVSDSDSKWCGYAYASNIITVN